jgi:hypothetical protein
MGFLKNALKGVGEIAGTVTGFVGGVSVLVTGNIVAGAQDILGFEEGAKATREVTDSAADFVFEASTEIGKGLGELTGTVSEKTIEITSKVGEGAGAVAGVVAGTGVMAGGFVVGAAQSLTGYEKAGDRTMEVAENIADKIVDVGPTVGKFAGKVVGHKLLLGAAGLAAVGMLADVADTAGTIADGADALDTADSLMSGADAVSGAADAADAASNAADLHAGGASFAETALRFGKRVVIDGNYYSAAADPHQALSNLLSVAPESSDPSFLASVKSAMSGVIEPEKFNALLEHGQNTIPEKRFLTAMGDVIRFTGSPKA